MSACAFFFSNEGQIKGRNNNNYAKRHQDNCDVLPMY